MAIDFHVKDVMHTIAVKFVQSYLPNATQPYHLKAVHQPELDIHGIASKADLYNITTSPKVIEEGFTAALELIFYLVADGFRIKTPLFTIGLSVPGEYNGSETSLHPGLHPTAKLQIAAAFREFLMQYVTIEFDGIDQTDGIIGKAVDEATGLADDCATIGNFLNIYGSGLKIEWEDATKSMCGVYFDLGDGNVIKAPLLAINEPRTLKIVVPSGLVPGQAYHLKIITQSSAKGNGYLLKNPREVVSQFTLTAHT